MAPRVNGLVILDGLRDIRNNLSRYTVRRLTRFRATAAAILVRSSIFRNNSADTFTPTRRPTRSAIVNYSAPRLPSGSAGSFGSPCELDRRFSPDFLAGPLSRAVPEAGQVLVVIDNF